MESIFRTPQLFLIGEIVGAYGFDSTNLYAKYEFRIGEHYRLLAGSLTGQTFHTYGRLDDLVAWDHPFDIHLAVPTMRGWPKLFVEIWTTDEHGRHQIKGYGIASIPMFPGSYDIEIVTWRPAPKTLIESLSSNLLGANPELQYKDMVLSGNDRFGLKCITSGKVSVKIGVICKDFLLHGLIM